VSSEVPDAAHADGQPAGSIEDTTAELLRPMLRAWLSDNMPRMVEKALHIEVAESVRTGKKPTNT
jgi:cell pole-organizing protein PopZ